jgi:hypothetical protein
MTTPYIVSQKNIIEIEETNSGIPVLYVDTGVPGPQGPTGPTGSTTHSEMTDLQGGTVSEYYHLTAAEYAALATPTHNLSLGIQGGASDDYYHITSVQHTDLTNTTTGRIIPAGTSAQRGATVTAVIRYNTELGVYEGYSPNSDSWGSLGGVMDIDQDTYITVEESSDDDTIRMYCGNAGNVATQMAYVDENGFNILTDLTLTGDFNITGTINATGVENLEVADRHITVNAGSTTLSATAGIIVNRVSHSYESVVYDAGDNSWKFMDELGNVHMKIDLDGQCLCPGTGGGFNLGDSGTTWYDGYFTGWVNAPVLKSSADLELRFGSTSTLTMIAGSSLLHFDTVSVQPDVSGNITLGTATKKFSDGQFSGTVYTPNVVSGADLNLKTNLNGGYVDVGGDGGDVFRFHPDGFSFEPISNGGALLGTTSKRWATLNAQKINLDNTSSADVVIIKSSQTAYRHIECLDGSDNVIASVENSGTVTAMGHRMKDTSYADKAEMKYDTTSETIQFNFL